MQKQYVPPKRRYANEITERCHRGAVHKWRRAPRGEGGEDFCETVSVSVCVCV